MKPCGLNRLSFKAEESYRYLVAASKQYLNSSLQNQAQQRELIILLAAVPVELTEGLFLLLELHGNSTRYFSDGVIC